MDPQNDEHWAIMATLFGAMAAVYFYIKHILRPTYERRALDDRALARHALRRQVIDRVVIESDLNCLWDLRMCRNTFARLYELLSVRGGLVQYRRVIVEEQVATFVNILAHHTKNRSLQVRFDRSGATVNRCCHRVLRAVIEVCDVLLAQPEPISDDCTDER